MKKTLYIAGAALFCALFATNSMAVDLVQSGAGQAVTIAVTVPGAQDVSFNPSTNVIMSGQSDVTAFGVAGYHTQALGKDSGQAYLMTADENKMFFLDISANGTPAGPTSSGTTKAAFTEDWHTL